jgi:hypothetical protein
MPANLCVFFALATDILGASAALPPTSGPTGTIAGTVRSFDSTGVAYANVMVEATRLGAQTDSVGRFLIRGVPPGRATVIAQAIGYDTGRDTVTVRPGEVATLDVFLPDPFRQRQAAIRDSLRRAGRWPPRLDSLLAARIRASTVATAHRLRPLPGIIGKLAEGPPRTCALAWRDTLLAALGAADFVSPALGVKYECPCEPEVRVRLSGGGAEVQVNLCYSCGEVGIRSGATSQLAFFGGGCSSFVRFARALFPADPELPRDCGPRM